MLKKIAAVAAAGIMTALPVVVPAQAQAASLDTPCGWRTVDGESLYYNNCSRYLSKAVYYGFGINPWLENCVTVPANTDMFIMDRAVPIRVAYGHC